MCSLATDLFTSGLTTQILLYDVEFHKSDDHQLMPPRYLPHTPAGSLPVSPPMISASRQALPGSTSSAPRVVSLTLPALQEIMPDYHISTCLKHI